jgi:hypothetical protein
MTEINCCVGQLVHYSDSEGGDSDWERSCTGGASEEVVEERTKRW